MWETQVRSLGWEYPLEKEMATIPVFYPNPTDGGAWQATVHGVAESDMTEPFSLTISSWPLLWTERLCFIS